jgi:hypothetical protein
MATNCPFKLTYTKTVQDPVYRLQPDFTSFHNHEIPVLGENYGIYGKHCEEGKALIGGGFGASSYIKAEQPIVKQEPVDPNAEKTPEMIKKQQD